MPYYIYRICSVPFRRLEKLEQHHGFRDASARAKVLRAASGSTEQGWIKVILADNELHAEDLLSELRSPQPDPADD